MAKRQITVADATSDSHTPPLAWIEAFVQVVDAGSFSAAARRLGLPKSSVSRAVAKLEHALGAVLLQRTTRSLAITAEGELYLARARSALSILADARSELAESDSEPRGLVRFTAPADSASSFLTPALARFVLRHPRVQLECLFTQRRVDLVAEGVDLALRAGVVDDASLVGRRLGGSERAVYAAPAYLAERGRPRRLADLTRHACVLFGGARGRARWSLQGPHGEEHVEVQGRVDVNEVGAMVTLTVLGVGVGLLPITVARREEQAGRLVRLFPRHHARGGAVYLVHPASSHLPRRVALLRDHLYAELRPHFAGEDAG